MFGKISIYEQIIRYGIGAILIALSVIRLQIPLWCAFVATYPIFTTMVQRDPLYALLIAIRRQLMQDMKGMVPARHAYTSIDKLWQERMESINDHEKHLARNGTVIVKFWLTISKKEQRKRFLSRIDVPRKNWKFSEADVHEREYWHDYMSAYEKALAATSKEWAPWYAITADDKPYLHYCVADIVV
jgi:hypothetical protein